MTQYTRRCFLAIASAALYGTSWIKDSLAKDVEAPVMPDSIRIGVAGPVSGPLAGFGAELFAGADMAAEYINAGSGIEGRKLEILLADDEGEPGSLAEVVKYFTEKKVLAVVGHFHSSMSMLAAPLYEKAGILMISPTATARELTSSGLWNVFRTAGEEDALTQFAVQQITQRFPKARLAVVHDGSTRSVKETEIFKKTIAIPDLLIETMAKDDARIRVLAARLKTLGIEVVFFSGGAYEAGRLVREFRDSGMKTILIGTESLGSPVFWTASGAGGEGTYVAGWGDPSQDSPSAPLHEYAKDKNIIPTATMARTFAAVEAIVMGIRLSKSDDPRKIAEKLKSGAPFACILGPESFTPQGNLKNLRVELRRWQNGTLIAQSLPTQSTPKSPKPENAPAARSTPSPARH